MHFVRYNWWKHALSLQSNAVQSVQYMRGICRLVMRRPRYKNTTSDKLKITNMELYKQAALHTFSLQRRKSIMQQLPFKRHWCGNSIPSTSKDQRAGFSEHGQGELESSKVMMACLHSSKLHRTPHFFTAKTEVYHAAVAISKGTGVEIQSISSQYHPSSSGARAWNNCGQTLGGMPTKQKGKGLWQHSRKSCSKAQNLWPDSRR